MWFVAVSAGKARAWALMADPQGGARVPGELAADTLEELRAMLPPGLKRTDRSAVMGPEVEASKVAAPVNRYPAWLENVWFETTRASRRAARCANYKRGRRRSLGAGCDGRRPCGLASSFGS